MPDIFDIRKAALTTPGDIFDRRAAALKGGVTATLEPPPGGTVPFNATGLPADLAQNLGPLATNPTALAPTPPMEAMPNLRAGVNTLLSEQQISDIEKYRPGGQPQDELGPLVRAPLAVARGVESAGRNAAASFLHGLNAPVSWFDQAAVSKATKNIETWIVPPHEGVGQYVGQALGLAPYMLLPPPLAAGVFGMQAGGTARQSAYEARQAGQEVSGLAEAANVTLQALIQGVFLQYGSGVVHSFGGALAKNLATRTAGATLGQVAARSLIQAGVASTESAAVLTMNQLLSNMATKATTDEAQKIGQGVGGAAITGAVLPLVAAPVTALVGRRPTPTEKPQAAPQPTITEQPPARPAEAPVMPPAPAKALRGGLEAGGPPTESYAPKDIRIEYVSQAVLSEVRAKIAKLTGRNESVGESGAVRISRGGKSVILVNNEMPAQEQAESLRHELRHAGIDARVAGGHGGLQIAKQIVEFVESNPTVDPTLLEIVQVFRRSGYPTELLANELLAEGILSMDRAEGDLTSLKQGKGGIGDRALAERERRLEAVGPPKALGKPPIAPQPTITEQPVAGPPEAPVVPVMPAKPLRGGLEAPGQPPVKTLADFVPPKPPVIEQKPAYTNEQIAAKKAEIEGRGQPAKAEPKQPWEMTQAEYLSSRKDAFPSRVFINAAGTRAGRAERRDFDTRMAVLRQATIAGHARDIQDALTRGEDVNRHVIADYKGHPWADAALAKMEAPPQGAPEVSTAKPPRGLKARLEKILTPPEIGTVAYYKGLIDKAENTLGVNHLRNAYLRDKRLKVADRIEVDKYAAQRSVALAVVPIRPDVKVMTSTLRVGLSLPGDIVVKLKSDVGRDIAGIGKKVGEHAKTFPGEDAKLIAENIKALLDTTPEFAADPFLKVSKEKKLVFRDGYKFSFEPAVFGLTPEQVSEGQRIHIDLADFGIDAAKYIKQAEKVASRGPTMPKPFAVKPSSAIQEGQFGRTLTPWPESSARARDRELLKAKTFDQLDAIARKEGAPLVRQRQIWPGGSVDEVSLDESQLRQSIIENRETQRIGGRQQAINEAETAEEVSFQEGAKTPGGEGKAVPKLEDIQTEQGNNAPIEEMGERGFLNIGKIGEVVTGAGRIISESVNKITGEVSRPMTQTLGGRATLQKLDAAGSEAHTLYGSMANDMYDALKGLKREDRVALMGVTGDGDGVVQALVENRLTSDNPRIQQYVEAYRKMLEVTGDAAEKTGLLQRDKKGNIIPFKGHQARDTFLRVFTPDFYEAMERQDGPTFWAIVKAIADRTGRYPADVRKELAESRANRLRHVSLETSREIPELPAYVKVNGKWIAILETDPQTVLLQGARRQADRIAFVKHFGQDMAGGEYKVDRLRERIMAAGGPEAADSFDDAIRAYNRRTLHGSEPWLDPRSTLKRLARVGTEIPMTTLTSLSALVNLPQPLMSVPRRVGVINYVKAIYRSLRHPIRTAERMGAVDAANRSIANTLIHKGRIIEDVWRLVKGTFSSITGLHWAVELNNMVASEAGLALAERWAKHGAPKSDLSTMRDLRLRPVEIQAAMRGNITPELRAKIAQNMVKVTQFVTESPWRRSRFQHSPTLQTTFAFLNYAIGTTKETGRLFQEWGSAARSGSKGRVAYAAKHTLYALAGALGAGTLSRVLRSIVKGKGLWDDDDTLWSFAGRALWEVQLLGPVQRTMDAFTYGGGIFERWAVGLSPLLASVGEVFNAIAGTGKYAYMPWQDRIDLVTDRLTPLKKAVKAQVENLIHPQVRDYYRARSEWGRFEKEVLKRPLAIGSYEKTENSPYYYDIRQAMRQEDKEAIAAATEAYFDHATESGRKPKDARTGLLASLRMSAPIPVDKYRDQFLNWLPEERRQRVLDAQRRWEELMPVSLTQQPPRRPGAIPAGPPDGPKGP